MTKNKPKNNYQGGAEEFKGFTRLSSNENNDGPSHRVKTAIKKILIFQISILNWMERRSEIKLLKLIP